jgi:hypothetical protein
MYILNIYECQYFMCIQRLLLELNGLHIMLTQNICFEYIETLCKIF